MKLFKFVVQVRRKGDRSLDAWKHLARCKTREEAQIAISMRQGTDTFLTYEFRILEK